MRLDHLLSRDGCAGSSGEQTWHRSSAHVSGKGDGLLGVRPLTVSSGHAILGSCVHFAPFQTSALHCIAMIVLCRTMIVWAGVRVCRDAACGVSTMHPSRRWRHRWDIVQQFHLELHGRRAEARRPASTPRRTVDAWAVQADDGRGHPTIRVGKPVTGCDPTIS